MDAIALAAQKKIFDRLLDMSLAEAEQVVALQQLGLDVIDFDLMVYAVERLRALMIAVDAPAAGLVDLCGTGGDHSGSFNISTTAALVAAGAGVRVAKHGNVAMTSKSGSIDMLRALGIALPETPEAALAQLEQTGIMFLCAPYYHPVFKRFAQARKILAGQRVRTVFNLLGPLLNPARVKRGVIGVFHPNLVAPMAEALLATGMEKALVVHGNGLDELSLTGTNTVCEIRAGKISPHDWGAEDFGLPSCALADLAGGDPVDNAAMTLSILQGETTGPKAAIVTLNAGAALYAASDDAAFTLSDGIAQARQSLQDGKALAVLERLRT